MKLGFVGTTSYNGIVAVNVDGNTICSSFHIFDTSDKRGTAPIGVFDFKKSLDADNMSFLIVDEISTVNAQIIAILDLCLQQVYNNNLPFGGMPVMFAGDFNQLGPVHKNFIPTDMMTWARRLQKAGQIQKPPQPTSTTQSTSRQRTKDPPKQASAATTAKHFINLNRQMVQRLLS